MTDKRILERVKKLLAMAADTSSPEEAAIAARRASRLMEQHNITQAEVLTRDNVEDRIGSGFSADGYKRTPLWYNILALPVAKLYDCEVQGSRLGDGKWYTEFLGFDEDTTVAVWVLDYLRVQIDLLAKAYKRDSGADRTEMNEFRYGCSRSICLMLEDERQAKQARMRDTSPGKGLMVMKRELIQQKYDIKYKTSAGMRPQTMGYMAGRIAGASVTLRQGLEASDQERIDSAETAMEARV